LAPAPCVGATPPRLPEGNEAQAERNDAEDGASGSASAPKPGAPQGATPLLLSELLDPAPTVLSTPSLPDCDSCSLSASDAGTVLPAVAAEVAAAAFDADDGADEDAEGAVEFAEEDAAVDARIAGGFAHALTPPAAAGAPPRCPPAGPAGAPSRRQPDMLE